MYLIQDGQCLHKQMNHYNNMYLIATLSIQDDHYLHETMNNCNNMCLIASPSKMGHCLYKRVNHYNNIYLIATSIQDGHYLHKKVNHIVFISPFKSRLICCVLSPLFICLRFMWLTRCFYAAVYALLWLPTPLLFLWCQVFFDNSKL